MDSSSAFDIDAHAALVTGAWTFAAAALIWAEILWLRHQQSRAERTAKEVNERWHPLLSLASFGMLPEKLPPLRQKEHRAFLTLWVYFQTSVRGDAREVLSQVARQLHCDALALRMLARGNRGDKLLATVVAGHLGLQAALAPLRAQAESKDSVLSLQALHSVLRIAPDSGAALISLCVQREDWPVAQMLPSLRPVSAQLTAPLLAALERPQPSAVLRALQLLTGLRAALELNAQQRLLHFDSPALLTEALTLIDHPSLLNDLRRLLRHPDERVRTATIDTLARIGNAGDLDTLGLLLYDLSWRVRNSAARAIVSLPGGGTSALRRIADACTDRYGRNMADHVLADMALTI